MTQLQRWREALDSIANYILPVYTVPYEGTDQQMVPVNNAQWIRDQAKNALAAFPHDTHKKRAEHTCHDMNPPFPGPCLACKAEQHGAEPPALDSLYKAIHGVIAYRQHLTGYDFNHTEFCSCGMREAMERLDAAWKGARADTGARQTSLNLGSETPWPLRDVLIRLVEAADHLLTVHDCDHLGWEILNASRDAARRYVAEIEAGARQIEEHVHDFRQVEMCVKCWRSEADIHNQCHHCNEPQDSGRCWWCGRPQQGT